MPQKLNRHAQDVIDEATELAQSLNHNYVGTEHLFKILLGRPKIAHVLRQFGLDVEAVTSLIDEALSPGELLRGVTQLVPMSHYAIGAAQMLAERQNAAAIGPEHLMAGLVYIYDGAAFNALHEIAGDRADFLWEMFTPHLAA